MQGYKYQDHCYSTMEGALSSWASTWPQMVNGQLTSLNSYLDIGTGNGLFSYSIFYIDEWSNNVETNGSAYMQLCTLPNDFISFDTQIPTQSLLLFAVIFIVAMMGFRAGFRP